MQHRALPSGWELPLILVVAVLLVNGPAHAAPAADDHTVLVLEDTVYDGTLSLEAAQAALSGFTVEIATAAQWAAKTAADFASYRAIVLGDPYCSFVDPSPVAAAEANKAVWGPAITGNVIVLGTDPVAHQVEPGAVALIKQGIEFAAARSGRTGAYVSLSCYYYRAPSGTPVPVLDPFGSFTVVGQTEDSCPQLVRIVAPAHPVMSGLVDADLSDWGCSTHEAFVTFPADFEVLALQEDMTAPWPVGPAGAVSAGAPYIIARSALCPTCQGDAQSVVEVVVDQNVVVDFNQTPPVCRGDADLCNPSVFGVSKPDAGKPQTWKAIFDVGSRQLRVKSGATIATVPVPRQSGTAASPGIEIRSTCCLVVEEGGAIVVSSRNQRAGDITIRVNGHVQIDGVIANAVRGAAGAPGRITIASCCGDIVTGPRSRIETAGNGQGGSDINLLACADNDCRGGNIEIGGLVRALYKGGTPATVNVSALKGAVTIDGTSDLGPEVIDGLQYRVTSGVVVFSTRDPRPGTIRIQADGNVTVLGNHILEQGRTQFGAVAVKTGSSSSQGGTIDVRSLGGRIVASDRAFDNRNRYNATAVITLLARDAIELSVTAAVDNGAADNAKPVVNVGAGSGGQGGTNALRSFSGDISIGAQVELRADFMKPSGSSGANDLTACTGVLNLGTVVPAAFIATKCPGAEPAVPAPLYTGCADPFGVEFADTD